MRSIRRNLNASLLVGAALLASVSGFTSSRLVENHLRHDFDRALLDKAEELASLTQFTGRAVRLDFADELMPEFSRLREPEYFELSNRDGKIVERSRSLGGSPLVGAVLPIRAPRFSDLTLPDGRPGRMVELSFFARRPDEAGREGAIEVIPARPEAAERSSVLAVARGREDLERLAGKVRWIYLGAAGCLVAAMGVLVRGALARGLRPLDDLAEQVEAIAGDPSRRIEPCAGVAELAPIVARLNELLGVLDSALERERRFSADVAHELRTPVAELRSLAEVGCRWQQEPAAAAAFFEDALMIATQMESVVGQLLALARAEGGTELAARATVRVGALVENACMAMEDAAAARGVRLQRSLPADFEVTTDAEKLTLVVGNLLSNAVRWSPEGSAIEVTVSSSASGWQLSVANPAPHLEPEDTARMFDRFWRKDSSRSDGSHAGLGLALVKSLAGALHLTVSAELSPARRLTLWLRERAGQPTGARAVRR